MTKSIKFKIAAALFGGTLALTAGAGILLRDNAMNAAAEESNPGVALNEKTVYVNASGDVSANEKDGYTAYTIGLKMAYGASVRYTDTQSDSTGMRFKTLVEKSSYDKLPETAKEKISFGTLIGPADLNESGLTIESAEANYINVAQDKSWYTAFGEGEDSSTAYYVYNSAIVDIYQANYSREFIGVGYMKIEYSAESTEYVYATANNNTRSVKYVAQQALEKESDLTFEKSTVLNTYTHDYTIASDKTDGVSISLGSQYANKAVRLKLQVSTNLAESEMPEGEYGIKIGETEFLKGTKAQASITDQELSGAVTADANGCVKLSLITAASESASWNAFVNIKDVITGFDVSVESGEVFVYESGNDTVDQFSSIFAPNVAVKSVLGTDIEDADISYEIVNGTDIVALAEYGAQIKGLKAGEATVKAIASKDGDSGSAEFTVTVKAAVNAEIGTQSLKITSSSTTAEIKQYTDGAIGGRTGVYAFTQTGGGYWANHFNADDSSNVSLKNLGVKYVSIDVYSTVSNEVHVGIGGAESTYYIGGGMTEKGYTSAYVNGSKVTDTLPTNKWITFVMDFDAFRASEYYSKFPNNPYCVGLKANAYVDNFTYWYTDEFLNHLKVAHYDESVTNANLAITGASTTATYTKCEEAVGGKSDVYKYYTNTDSSDSTARVATTLTREQMVAAQYKYITMQVYYPAGQGSDGKSGYFAIGINGQQAVYSDLTGGSMWYQNNPSDYVKAYVNGVETGVADLKADTWVTFVIDISGSTYNNKFCIGCVSSDRTIYIGEFRYWYDNAYTDYLKN